MPKLMLADCFRIALWFVGEEEFQPSERLLIQRPFSDAAIRAALREFQELAAQGAGSPLHDLPKTDLVRALRAIRRFCVPDVIISRVQTLLRDIRALPSSVSLFDSLSGLLQASDLFHASKAWGALKETMEKCSGEGCDEKLRKILMEIGNATGALRPWYVLQDQLKHPPFGRGELPLTWKLDRKRLSDLLGAIDVYVKCAGDSIPQDELSVIMESKAVLRRLGCLRPPWAAFMDVVTTCQQMLEATNPPRHTKLDDMRVLLGRAADHLGRFSVPQTDAEIATAFDILNELQADLSGYLVNDQSECGDAVRAQLAKCLQVAEQFLSAVPATRSLTAVETSLNEARTRAPGRVAPAVCGLVDQLSQAYLDLIRACRKQLTEQARTAAELIETLTATIRKLTADGELLRLCDSIERLLDPLAEYQQAYERLKQLEPPPRAAVFADLTECLDDLMRLLQQTTDTRMARVEHRVEQLLPLALDREPLECLLLAIEEFREAASRDTVDALRNYGDDICDWGTAYRPAFDAARFSPPTGEDYCELRESLATLRPAEIVKRLKTTHPERPYPGHTLRLMEELAEYEKGLDALGVFLPEYTRHVSPLDSARDPSDGPGEFERFRAWLSRQQFRFPPPQFSPWPYADFAAWLIALPVSQQADVLRVMLIGPWSDIIDGRVMQLMEEKPSIFTVAAKKEAQQSTKTRALLFLIHALATYRPFNSNRQLWETICPPYYRQILPTEPTIVEHMLKAVENAIAAWRSARMAGAPGLPATYSTGMEVVNAWNYLLGDERLSKQVAEGKLRRRSRRIIVAQFLLESAFAGPATEILDSLCRDPYRELDDFLRRQVPRIARFYGTNRRVGWAGFVVSDIMNDVNRPAENQHQKTMSPEEKQKKRLESRRRHNRIKAEEQIIITKIEGLLDRLARAITVSCRNDQTLRSLRAQHGLLMTTLSMYRGREKSISDLRTAKKKGSLELPTHQVGVLEACVEETYDSLYRLANQVAASYPYLADQARGAGFTDLAKCLEQAGRATVDLVYGFVRGRRKRHPGDTKQGSDLDSRPRGLQYLIMRKWMDDDDLLEELLEPPR